MPSYATEGSAGMDLRAYLTENIKIKSMERIMVKTGLYVELPNGYEAQIRPRSGLAIKDGISVINSPGTIDCVPSGTKIKTKDGDVVVEDLYNKKEKTIILSYNNENDMIEEDILEDMWIVKNKPLLKITTKDNDVIEIPHDKEVYTNRGWVKAKNLNMNDKILKLD